MSSTPPPPNPILSAYEQFVQDTPLITRYTISTLLVTWFSTFFGDSTLALSNITFFTIYKFEIYRILLAPLLCNTLFSLIFAYMSFVSSGKRLELNMGSTAFAWLMLTTGLVTNIAHAVLCISGNLVTGDKTWLLNESSGIWTILFGLIAIECCKDPLGSERQLFFFSVPTRYYPIALMVLFSLFRGSMQYAYIISIGFGYAYGYGKLDLLKVSNSRFKQWEDNTLANFTQRQGWIVRSATVGDGVWSTEQQSQGIGGGLRRFFQQRMQSAEESGASGGSATGGAPGNVPRPVDPAIPTTQTAFLVSGGRALGGASRRPAMGEPKAAALAAAEKRSSGQSDHDEENP